MLLKQAHNALAQQAADALMARDPQLQTAPLLRQRIVRLFEQHGEGSFN